MTSPVPQPSTPRAREGAPSSGRSQRLFRVIAQLATPLVDEPDRGRVDAASSEKLVVEFDEAYTAFVEGFEALPSESQMIALQAVDTTLTAMVGARDATLWTTAARRTSPHWSEVRRLAETVLDEFGRSFHDPELEVESSVARQTE